DSRAIAPAARAPPRSSAAEPSRDRLKAYLKCELDDARIRGTDHLAESRAQCHARQTKVRVVESVEELGAKLRRDALGDWKSLRQVEIKIHQSRASNDSDS